MALTFGRVLDGKTATRIEREVASTIKRQETDWKGNTFYTLLLVMLMLTLLILAVLIYGVVADGWDVLTGWLPSFLGGTLGSIKAFEDQTLGVQQGLAGSFWIAVFVAVLSFPIGIAAAIYLEEYAPKNRFSNFIELNIRNLAGVPSVVYGLLGLFLFVEGIPSITGGRTAASAGLTLAILVLPIVIITAQEALRAVPDALKEGSYGVGATRWETIRRQALPYAAPGILTGTLLSMSRAIGEAAPLILVGAITGFLGSNPSITDPRQLDDAFTAMPILITGWTQNPMPEFRVAAAAAIVVLLVFVLLLNAATIFLRYHFEKKRQA